MRTELLDFYGVKMINNTRGVGDVLGTRMLKIQTRRIPEHLREEFGGVLPTESARHGRLRDELHTWAFESVGLIESTYRALYPRTSARADEIAASLYVMASIAGDQELRSRLEVALMRQRGGTLRLDDPEWMLREVLKNLVAQGYDTVSPTHLSLEIRRLIGSHGGAAAEDVPEWVRPGWVGRMLRGLGMIDEAGEGLKRERVFGLNLRFYPLRASYLAQVKEGFTKRGTDIQLGTKRPTDFCGECASCPYSSHDCEIMWKRQAAKQ